MMNIRKEKQKVNGHLSRAKRAGVAATLTLDQWFITLEHFNYRCAYCQRLPYEVLEHMVSITKGGGTTASNVVPACRSCNSMKDNRWEQKIFTGDPDEAFKRVQAYLDTLKADGDETPSYVSPPHQVARSKKASQPGPRLIIKELAESRNLNKSQLQMLSEVTLPMLDRYWHNTTRSVKLHALDRIAKALGVQVRDLFAVENGESEKAGVAS